MVGPTLTVNLSGNPYVEVSLADVLPGTSTVRFERVSDGRKWAVRGGIGISSDVAVLDFEAPFCVPSTYRAECFDASGNSLGFTDSSTVTVWEDRTIVHQPLNPQMWVNPVRLVGTVGSIRRPSEGTLVKVQGAAVSRVIGSGRAGVTASDWSFLTTRFTDADNLQQLLGTYEVQQLPVLCIRTPPPMRVPRTFFAHVPDLAETQLDTHMGGQLLQFDFKATEVEPPFPGLTTPLLTYDDIDAAYGSYDLADQAYASYTDRDRDYSLAGSA
jgi:hypothetical protein